MSKQEEQQIAMKVKKAMQSSHWKFDAFNFGMVAGCKELFFTIHQDLPNLMDINDISGEKLRKKLDAQVGKDIYKAYYSHHLKSGKRNAQLMHAVYIFNNGNVLEINDDTVEIAYLQDQQEQARALMNQVKKHRSTKKTSFSIVVSAMDGLRTKSLELKKVNVDINSHYNDDLMQVHPLVMDQINKNNQSGICLFYGQPGTGKSTYIKYLIANTNKQVIFLPPKLAGNLDTPAFLDFLLNHRNVILVIEEAEQLIVQQNGERNSAISMLLNLTDGLLGDSLGIQILATFNTDIGSIDKALLRKGRLKVMYEFEKLATNKSNLLLQQLKTNYQTQVPMTLADIYHHSTQAYEYDQYDKKVGFGWN